MGNPVTFGEHRYELIHVVHNGDPGAGFSALITYALNGVRRAEARHWLPVVDFTGSETPYFHDPAYGDNVWEYYFEPVAGVSSGQLRTWLESGKVTPDQVHRFSDQETVGWHVNDPDRITTFWGPEQVEDRAAWMREKRRVGRDFVRRYVRPKPHVALKVDRLAERLIRPGLTFGVHIRGTDFGYAKATEPEAYFRALEAKGRELGSSDFRVFLATDQEQFVTAFEARFPGRVATCDALRSGNDIAPFKLQDVSPYKKGEDVLLDMLLLSRCQYLFKSVSAVGEYALWFNPALECTDFALTSEFLSDKPLFWRGGYLQLDVDKQGPLRVALLMASRLVTRSAEGLWRRLLRGWRRMVSG
jgi:hypothetical protein